MISEGSKPHFPRSVGQTFRQKKASNQPWKAGQHHNGPRLNEITFLIHRGKFGKKHLERHIHDCPGREDSFYSSGRYSVSGLALSTNVIFRRTAFPVFCRSTSLFPSTFPRGVLNVTLFTPSRKFMCCSKTVWIRSPCTNRKQNKNPQPGLLGLDVENVTYFRAAIPPHKSEEKQVLHSQSVFAFLVTW